MKRMKPKLHSPMIWIVLAFLLTLFASSVYATGTATPVNFNIGDQFGPSVINLVPPVNSSFNISTTIEIAANVTDFSGVDTVLANVTLANGSSILLTLNNSLGDIFNTTFTLPNLTGEINVSIIANDTSANINDSEFTNFSVVDEVPPMIITLGCVPANPQVNESILCNATITDDIGISNFSANVTLPNGTLFEVNVSNLSENFFFNFTNTLITGTYNITWFANDTFANNANASDQFIVADDIAPNVTIVQPQNTSIFNVTDTITIVVNATDNGFIETVVMNISIPGDGTQLVTLTPAGGDLYEVNFTNATLLGVYNMTAVANDTSGNTNFTTGNFTVVDNFPPTIVTLGCVPDPAQLGDTVLCNATLVDFSGIDNVTVNLTLPNGTVVMPPLENNSENYFFNFTVPFLPGDYNFTWFGNDTFGNDANASDNFTVQADNTPPNVTDITPVAGSAFNISETIEIGANITDDIQVNATSIVVVLPNGTAVGVTLGFGSGDFYNTSFVIPNVTGQYNVTFFANDTSGNLNGTEVTFFTVGDGLAPVVDIVEPINASFNATDTVTITVNVTDEIGVDTVLANISIPGDGTVLLTLTPAGGDLYQVNFSNTTLLGLYNITIIANDTSGNVGTDLGNFTIVDQVPPVIVPLGCIPNPANPGDNVQCNATVTDLFGPDNVSVNITLPNGTIVMPPVNNESENYFFNFTVPPIEGDFNITWIANDTFANNATALDNFTSNDTLAPSIFDLVPLANSSFNSSTTIEIGANITDNLAVNVTYVNITLPNGTTLGPLNLTFTGGNFYNTSFTIPNLTGQYNVTFFGNDTSNNINSTELTFFVGGDGLAPVVTVVSPINASFNISDTITIVANVTDEIGVDTVQVNVSIPGDGSVLLNMTPAGGDLYEVNFTNSTFVGLYNFTVTANDTSGNLANDTGNFTVVADNTPPNVTDLIPNASTQFNVSTTIEIGANITDDGFVNVTTINVTLPNGTTLGPLALGLGAGDFYNTSFVIPNLTGQYNVTFFANDSSGNVNSTESTFFVGLDNIAPTVTVVAPINATYNATENVTLVVNVTDNIGVATVIANISIPGDGTQLVTLTPAGGDLYEVNFSNTSTLGTYNFTVFANDTSGNLGNDTGTFTVVDNVPPVIIPLGCVPDPAQVGDNVQCNATVVDLFGPDNVTVNLTLPNGTVVFPPVNNESDNYFFNFTVPPVTGDYNVTWIANDTIPNNATANDSFTVQADVLPPNVTDLVPIAGSQFNVSDIIEIGANITDDVAVNVTTINITLPNGTTLGPLSLGLGSGDFYNTSFTIPNLIGNYSVVFFANDTSNNINSTETTFFVGLDDIPPNVTDVEPIFNTNFNVSTGIEIGANITDNIAVNATSIVVVLPNGTALGFSLGLGSGDFYNTTFVIPNITGQYNVTFFANDTSGNLNGSEVTFFIALDNLGPAVNITAPAVNETFNASSNVTITVNVTDNIGVDTVLVNITLPDGSTVLENLTSAGGDLFEVNFTGTTQLGTYNITAIANDTSGNLNDSEIVPFIVVDQLPPVIVPLGCVPDPAQVGDTVTCNATVTDLFGPDNVTVNLTLPNGTIVMPPVNNESENYFFNFTVPPVTGDYNITWIANDTTPNNATALDNFTVVDQVPPNVTDVEPINGSVFNVSDIIEVGANITDNGILNITTANVTLPNGSIVELDLVLVSGDFHNASFNLTDLIGQYNVTFFANDTDGNINSSETTTFILVDGIAPTIEIITPLGDLFNATANVTLLVNVTDNVGVDTVLANISIPGDGVQVVTLTPAGGDLFEVNFSNTSTLGLYNVTVVANDTSSNVQTALTNFTIVDQVPPVIVPLGCVPNPAQIGDTVLCNATVVDLFGPDNVTVNITLPNGTVVMPPLENNSENYFFNFTVPPVTGPYNITWIANDTIPNNATALDNFTVNDSLGPQVFDLTPVTGSVFNISTTIEIGANITDETGLNVTSISITLPNSTVIPLNLTFISGNFFNTSFTLPNASGTYVVTFFANDTSNNINNTEMISITGADPLGPQVNITSPANNTEFVINQTVPIIVNVTDNDAVDTVLANVTLANASSLIINLTPAGGDLYAFNFTITENIGNYSARVIANDTFGNVNDTEFVNFSIINGTSPVILAGEAIPEFNFNDTAELLFVNASNFDTLVANVTLPDGTSQLVTLNNTFNTSFFNTSQLGTYNVTFIASNAANTSTVFDNFTIFEREIFNASVVNASGDGINSSLTTIFVNSVFTFNLSENGTFTTDLFKEETFNLLFVAHEERQQVLLRNIGITPDNNKTLGMDKHNEISGFLVTYGVNNSEDYNFSSATVRIHYDDLSFTDESLLQLFLCADYNFSQRRCEGAQTDITSSATQNLSGDSFEVTVNNFSGFSIAQGTAAQAGGGTGGGGGGSGGGSSRNQCSLGDRVCDGNTLNICEDTLQGTRWTSTSCGELGCSNGRCVSCAEDWICDSWSSCSDGLQTRTCEDFNRCGTLDLRPAIERSCTSLELVEPTVEEPGDAEPGRVTEFVDVVVKKTPWWILFLLLLLVALLAGLYALLQQPMPKARTPPPVSPIIEDNHEEKLYMPMSYVQDAVEVLELMLNNSRKDIARKLRKYPPVVVSLCNKIINEQRKAKKQLVAHVKHPVLEKYYDFVSYDSLVSVIKHLAVKQKQGMSVRLPHAEHADLPKPLQKSVDAASDKKQPVMQDGFIVMPEVADPDMKHAIVRVKISDKDAVPHIRDLIRHGHVLVMVDISGMSHDIEKLKMLLKKVKHTAHTNNARLLGLNEHYIMVVGNRFKLDK